MAFETGTASNFNDFVDKLVSFLTTNPDLVAANRQWTLMRNRRNNIESVTTNMDVPSQFSNNAGPYDIMRVDARTIQYDDPNDNRVAGFDTSMIAGSSYIQMNLINPVIPKKLRMRSGSNYNYTPRKFKISYSDDGGTWTDLVEVAPAQSWPANGWTDLPIAGATSHKFWKITFMEGSSYFNLKSLLLLDDNDNILNHFGDELIFKAPGASGNEEIYTGIRAQWKEQADWYNLFLNGYVGFDNDFYTSFFDQPGGISGFGSTPRQVSPMVTLWNNATPYWFVASGRCFKLAAKISTSYVGGYLGFLLPYASPSQFPYPLVVGGNMVPNVESSARGSQYRFSYANQRNSCFFAPGADQFDNRINRDYRAGLYYRNNDGSWYGISNYGGSSDNDGIYPPDIDANFNSKNYYTGMWPHFTANSNKWGWLQYRECVGGGYLFQPCVLVERLTGENVVGELDGVYSVPGFSNAAENTGQYDGDTVVIFQNVYRTETFNYWGMRLN